MDPADRWTPADLRAALEGLAPGWRTYRYPDYRDTEPEDWAAFLAAIDQLIAGGRHAQLEHHLETYGRVEGAADVYWAWRGRRITEREGGPRRRRRR